MRVAGRSRSRLAGVLIAGLAALIAVEVLQGIRRLATAPGGDTSAVADQNPARPDDVGSAAGAARPRAAARRSAVLPLPALPVDDEAQRAQPAFAKGSIVTAGQWQSLRAHLARERLRPVEERLRLGGPLAAPREGWQGQADGIRRELKESLASLPAATISDGQCNQVGCRFSVEAADASMDVAMRGRLTQLLRGDTRTPFLGESIVSEALAGAKGVLRTVVVLFREPAVQPEDAVPAEVTGGDHAL